MIEQLRSLITTTLLVSFWDQNSKLLHSSTSFLLWPTCSGVLPEAVVGWTGRYRPNPTAALNLAPPPQAPTSPQIQVPVAAMCIQSTLIMRVSCSYQPADKLISQALASAGLPTGRHSDTSCPHLAFVRVFG